MMNLALQKEIERRGLTVREASREIGISHTTIYAIINGRSADISTLEAIAQWAGLPVMALINSPDDAVYGTITALLRYTPELADRLREAVVLLEAGLLTEDDLYQVLEFIDFKIQRLRKNWKEKAD